jgi:membrane protease YdiL (CAAX protease family)
MKKTVIAFIIMFLVYPLFCQTGESGAAGGDEAVEETEVSDSSGYVSRTGVVIAPSISAALVLFSMLEDMLFYFVDWGDSEYWIKECTMYSVHLPVYSVDLFKGLVFSGTTAGLVASYELLENEDADLFRSFIYTGIYQTGLFSTYVSYRDNRIKAKKGTYSDDWRQHTFIAGFSEELADFGSYYTTWKPYSFFDLMLSPFQPENLFDPAVYILPLAGIINPLISRSHDNAPWNTGRMYVGTWELAPYAAVPIMLCFFLLESSIIGVVEESHFRGFIYEEVGSSFGHIPAKIVDCLYFPAIHVPQEIILEEYDTGTILLNFVIRSLLTFYLDNLYDRGGLPRSVAAHMWMDFSLLFMYWLMGSGVPQTDIESIMAFMPEITIRIPLSY